MNPTPDQKKDTCEELETLLESLGGLLEVAITCLILCPTFNLKLTTLGDLCKWLRWQDKNYMGH